MSIYGRVKIAGKPADRVALTLVGKSFRAEAVTDEFGHFRFDGLKRGKYTLLHGADPARETEVATITVSDKAQDVLDLAA